MRVISGQNKGRRLKSANIQGLRPTSDRVKEALFNMLSPFLNEEVVVADFFAGTGNVGIEFLSRGVKEVVFVEKDERCVHLIKENLKDLGLSERAKVFKTDVLRFLRSKHCPIFDIIFLDPPYKSTYAAECIEEILKNNKISQNGLIVIESNLDFNFESAKLTILRQREYGDTKITIFSFGGRQF
ncbi:16S rRNA (guanine(966)-N(2))-methyltransferase RsmD [Caldicellulosiruptor changbaiensis]|uniref:16S rRNA (Guanine(966)-N(2))-methyltransferase RsmD n=1 Tax=Caldicellulosiruptor changbaiensis TaxID=1222016 RepID=A0A3T0D5Z2_9FIRM|nr:16S rRNA (guanine(966)-N(2))-methyltransferase RsmD [Caldicellulosiruptor changbaiensis]AZT90479.1 16S rRNA (guanine(966)-N(2))-methyltransferase RsmD [Caldicellulosiruptor changbaiensis]